MLSPQAMQKYAEAPWWWYIILLALSFFAGLVVVLKGETTLPWWSYIIGLLLGAFITVCRPLCPLVTIGD